MKKIIFTLLLTSQFSFAQSGSLFTQTKKDLLIEIGSLLKSKTLLECENDLWIARVVSQPCSEWNNKVGFFFSKSISDLSKRNIEISQKLQIDYSDFSFPKTTSKEEVERFSDDYASIGMRLYAWSSEVSAIAQDDFNAQSGALSLKQKIKGLKKSLNELQSI